MITFLPHRYLLVTSSSPAQETRKIYNETNKEFLTRLMELYQGKYCTDHPDFKNIILVDVGNAPTPLTVHEYCCEKFKPVLDAITGSASI